MGLGHTVGTVDQGGDLWGNSPPSAGLDRQTKRTECQEGTWFLM